MFAVPRGNFDQIKSKTCYLFSKLISIKVNKSISCQIYNSVSIHNIDWKLPFDWVTRRQALMCGSVSLLSGFIVAAARHVSPAGWVSGKLQWQWAGGPWARGQWAAPLTPSPSGAGAGWILRAGLSGQEDRSGRQLRPQLRWVCSCLLGKSSYTPSLFVSTLLWT